MRAPRVLSPSPVPVAPILFRHVHGVLSAAPPNVNFMTTGAWSGLLWGLQNLP